ncbi:peptidoglycan-binding protein [Streptomyces olivoreticuli]|uniref:peptidoglycan-binding protein n=1 Tax=Streptomyces olivoreticuli TaxID=68246 RepID=UPI000E2873ED|nr:efflux RND transporter periplasmic adaptor subunit [Streptomyces olivoreticuli]
MTKTAKERGKPRRRGTVAAGVGTVMVLGAIGAAMIFSGSDGDGTTGTRSAPPATAPVTKGDLTAAKTMPASLTHGTPTPLRGTLQGTVTWLPKPGDTISRGETLYKVDNRPVTALYGDTPMYRELKQGHEGPDVKQLNENLRALGYTAPYGDTYTGETTAAVRTWQKDRSLRATGTVEKGLVVFVSGTIRVGELKAQKGGPAAEAILTYTGRGRSVTAMLPLSDQKLARKGDSVDVILPGGKSVRGRITGVETVSPDASDGPGGGGESGADDKKKSEVKVSIAIEDQKALGDLRNATVDVDFTSEVRKNVFHVPITALVARTGGGYGLEVTGGGTTRTVPVELGMFSNGRVEVKGTDLRPGMKVAVPT